MRKPRAIAVIAASCVLVAALAWLMTRPAARDDAAETHAPRRATTGSDAATVSNSPAPASETERAAIAASPLTASSASPVPREFPAWDLEADLEPVTFVLVEKGSGRVLPGATLEWWSHECPSEPREPWASAGQRATDMPPRGRVRRGIADTRGRVSVVPLAVMQVAARFEDLAAEKSFTLAGTVSEVWLELERPAFVHAKVVAEDGSPVLDAVVQFAHEGRGGLLGRTVSLSGADGFARFDLKPSAVAPVRSDPSPADHKIRANVWGAEAELVTLREALAEPILLKAPPSGRVVVRVLDAEGSPWTGIAHVVLGTLPAIAREAVGGAATFDCVPAGQALAAMVYAPGREAVEAKLPEGVAAGETATMSAWLIAAKMRISGRVLDAATGAPAAERALRALLLVHELGPAVPDATGGTTRRMAGLRHSETLHGWTDAGGAFEFASDRAVLARGEGRLVLEALDPRGQVASTATAILPPGPVPDELALGDVVLREPSVVARGKVVDEAGNGLARAMVRVSKPRWGVSYPPLSGLETMACVTGADGSFVVHAYDGITPLGIDVVLRGFEPFQQKIGAGEPPLTIRLTRAR